MYFSFIYKKHNDFFIFCDNKIIKNLIPQNGKSWTYESLFPQKSIGLGQILVNGKSLEEVCPEHLKNDLNKTKNTFKSFLKSFKEGKVSMIENQFWEYVPEWFLKEFFGIKNEIIKYVFETYPKQPNYDFLYDLIILSSQIQKHDLNIDKKYLYSIENNNRIKSLQQRSLREKLKVKYNVFGSITGRFSTKKTSFPILTLDRKYRNILKPNNDWFIEIDFNSADLRSFLALNEVKQPQIDLHQWHIDLYNEYFKQTLTRDEMKKKFLGWLYNGENNKFGVPEIDQAYNKENIIERYFHDNKVITPFNRVIQTDIKKMIPLLTQSTTTDIFFKSVLKVNEYLKENNLKTYISFLIHDSMMLDLNKVEYPHLHNIIDIFSNTEYGRFLVKVKVGKTFGEMKDIII